MSANPETCKEAVSAGNSPVIPATPPHPFPPLHSAFRISHSAFRTCLYGGPIFDGERLLDSGTIVFDEEAILDVLPGDQHRGRSNAWNVQGKLIMPGMVDLHSDALEKCIEMRPGIQFDAEFALQCLDERLAACGITTFCHGISFAEDDVGIRACEEAERLVRLVHRFNRSGKALVRHLVHARYEITSHRGLPILEKLMDEAVVDMVSLMDHTPGQGQFKTLDSYVAYKTGTYKVSREDVVRFAEHKASQRERGLSKLVRIAAKVREYGIPFLSHDDDTAEKVEFVGSLGVTGSEFPVSMEAVEAARHLDMKVLMGAPNLFRDRSSNGHLRASEILVKGGCDAFVSDYYPECLLQVPFIANKRHKLELQGALRLVTANPGVYLKPREGTGRLLPGLRADLLVIDLSGTWARVEQTWVSGQQKLHRI